MSRQLSRSISTAPGVEPLPSDGSGAVKSAGPEVSLPPSPHPLASPSQAAAASGDISWLDLPLAFLLTEKSLDPLTRAVRTKHWQVTCCSFRGWGIMSLFLHNPAIRIHSLASDRSLTPQTLTRPVLRRTF